MRMLFKRSLLLRAGLTMASIALLALVSMSSSIVIAEMLRGQAAAINQAGSLRMQSFAITTRLLAGEGEGDLSYARAVAGAVQEYENRLINPRLTAVLPKDPNEELRATYDQLVREWDSDIKPLMSVYLYNAEPGPSAAASAGHPDLAPLKRILVTRIHAYVQHIDRFVSQLEHVTESKVAWLRLIQGVSLFLTLAVIYLAMYLLQTDVVTPLRDLLLSAERARRSDFSARVRHSGDDELGRLGHAFNVMAEDLSKIYDNLESRVRDKTAALERRNRSLELLYHTITQLAEGPPSDATYTVLLKRIERVLGFGPSVICLTEGAGERAFRLASTARASHNGAALCDQTACADCLGHTEAQLRELGPGGARRVFLAPLVDQKQNYGVLQMEIPGDSEFDIWQEQLLETIGRHIGIALGARHRASQVRRLALIEERTVIARELHDSLAQSLSYLKIQVSRLQSSLKPGDETAQSQAILNELRRGLNDAYRQLRELLTTFRIKMDGRGLSSALEATVEEFRRRVAAPDREAALEIKLSNHLAGCPLSVNEEIHVLQIVREALSNVARHAHASCAHVDLHCDGHMVTVTIDDNGIGFAPPPGGEPHHYGLVIMQERAHSLGGDIDVRRRAEGGTRVALRFTPSNFSASALQAGP
jgi:two-component system nitrate/nitrite sensor histidine kinase NarX